MSDVPGHLRYTNDHEWVRSDDSTTVRVGITDYAQEALGDVVYVSLPEVGASMTKGDAVGEVESTKSVSDIYAPLSGTVSARNERLDEHPELINSDPYGDGWMLEIDVSDKGDIDGLLDAAGYTELTG
jgi:glycine cleavage system H protein